MLADKLNGAEAEQLCLKWHKSTNLSFDAVHVARDAAALEPL